MKIFKNVLIAVFCFTTIVVAQINWNAKSITITTEAQLKEFEGLVNGRKDFSGQVITLAKDIDIKSGEWIPIGVAKNNAEFNGIFNGNGKVVRGIKIYGYDDGQGLFGFIGKNGVIKNLGVIVDIKGKNIVGGLTGVNVGTIENSYVWGNIEGDGLVGGLAGTNMGIIENSYASGMVTGNNAIGGLVGINSGMKGSIGSIKNSYASGNVTGIENTGGLVGASGGIIENSYALGKVTGRKNVGGFVGENIGTIINSYALINATSSGKFADINTGKICSNSGTKMETQMKQQSAYRDWNFANIWKIDFDINNGFPYLKSFAEVLKKQKSGGKGKSEDPKKALVGQWYTMESNVAKDLLFEKMEFLNDGSGLAESSNIRGIGHYAESFTWRIDSDGRLIHMTPIGIAQIYYIIEISNSTLILEGNVTGIGYMRTTYSKR